MRFASCVFVFVIGCGGGDSAEEKCVAFLETVCDRAVDCGLSSSHDACMKQVEQVTNCGEAEKVSDSYGACIDDIEEASCQALFPTTGGQQRLMLPASCANAID